MITRRPVAVLSLAAFLTLGAVALPTAPFAHAQESDSALVPVSGTTEIVENGGARRAGRAFRGSVRVEGANAVAEVTIGDGADAERRLISFVVPANARVNGIRIDERPAAEGAEDRVEEILSNADIDAARFVVHPVLADAATDEDTATDEDAADREDATDDAGASAAVKVLEPADGEILLVGQTIKLKTSPANARLEIDGPARRRGDELRLTGEGSVRIVARSRGERSRAITIRSVGLSIETLTVEGGLQIEDAPPPHFQRAVADDADPAIQPACIYQNSKLTLRARIAADARLSRETAVTLRAKSGDTIVEGRLHARRGFTRGALELASTANLKDHVAVNELDLAWEVVDAEGDAVALGERTPMRIYTTYRTPISNDIWFRTLPVATKLHYELACTWANGASKNIPNGRDSIGYQCDNQMRHHVHTEDFKDDTRPFIPAYRADAPKPLNYDVLPAAWSAKSRGARAVSELYYPPMDDEAEHQWEKYENYARNFGWWVLDNPTHTGGRCNQQASLVADILGTLGIRASVLLLHRVGRGKQTNRPVRQYFASSWNFHGVCNTILEDGSEYCYDGSFSFPPNRKNGPRAWAETVPGPFVDGWGTWLYEDRPGRVPDWDIPDTWQGIQ